MVTRLAAACLDGALDMKRIEININDIVDEFTPGQWHFIVLVRDEINLRLFIDGKEVVKP